MSRFRINLWKDRSHRFALGSSATITGAFFGIIRNKWLATHLHASGLGVLAQTTSIQSWLGTAAGMGLSLPVARAVAAGVGARDEVAVRRTVGTALSLVGIGSLVVAAAGLLLAVPISAALLGSPEHAHLVRIATLGAAGIAFQGILCGFFVGRSDLTANVTMAITAGIVSVGAALLLVPRWGIAGGAVVAALIAPAGAAGVLLLHRRAYTNAMIPLPRPLLDTTLARSILRVGAAALILSLIDLGIAVTVRAHYLGRYGASANGLLQAALALSQQVGTLFYTYLSNYAFGKVSAISGVVGVRAYTRRHWEPLVLLAALTFGAAMVAATPLLHVLYSSRFDPARPLMAWALWGEFCRVGMNIWAVGALPLGGAKLWFPLAVAPSVGLALFYTALSHTALGTMSLPLAYAGAGLFSLCVGGVVMSRAGVTLSKRNFAIAAVAASALAMLARWIAG